MTRNKAKYQALPKDVYGLIRAPNCCRGRKPRYRYRWLCSKNWGTPDNSINSNPNTSPICPNPLNISNGPPALNKPSFTLFDHSASKPFFRPLFNKFKPSSNDALWSSFRPGKNFRKPNEQKIDLKPILAKNKLLYQN